MSRAIPVVIILLLLVVAALGWMRPVQPTDDSAHAAYVDSMNTVSADQEALIRTLWDTVFSRDAALDSLRNIRLNPEVLQDQARQDVQRMDMDSVFSILDAPPQ